MADIYTWAAVIMITIAVAIGAVWATNTLIRDPNRPHWWT